jgi:hypothetical protein
MLEGLIQGAKGAFNVWTPYNGNEIERKHYIVQRREESRVQFLELDPAGSQHVFLRLL